MRDKLRADFAGTGDLSTFVPELGTITAPAITISDLFDYGIAQSLSNTVLESLTLDGSGHLHKDQSILADAQNILVLPFLSNPDCFVEVVLTCDASTVTQNVALLLRCNVSDTPPFFNYYGVYFKINATSILTLRKIFQYYEGGTAVAGSSAPAWASSAIYTTSHTFTLRVEMTGTTITAKVDGATVWTDTIDNSSGAFAAGGNAIVDWEFVDGWSGNVFQSTVSSIYAGDASVELPPDVGTISVTVPMATWYMAGPSYIRASAPLPIFHLYGPGNIRATAPMARVNIDAKVLPEYYNLGIKARAPMATAHMYGGGRIKARAPMARVTMTGTAQNHFAVTAVAPMPTFTIDASVGEIAKIVARAPMATAMLFSGGHIYAVAPMATCVATGRTGAVSALVATAPMATIAMTGFAGSTGSIVATAPMATARGGNGVVATAPMARVLISASKSRYTDSGIRTSSDGTPAAAAADVATVIVASHTITNTTTQAAAVDAAYTAAYAAYDVKFGITHDADLSLAAAIAAGAAAAEEVIEQRGAAFAVPLNNDAKPVTEYARYPFHSVVRFGDRHIGFGPLGAYNMTGIDDAGVEIEWGVTFGIAATPETNVNDGVYISGSFTHLLSLHVAVDDGITYTYKHKSPTTKQNTIRFTPGRGLQGFAWQFGLSGSGAMKMHRAEFLQRSLQRKIRYG